MQSLRDKVGGHRFLKIDITSHGKNGEDKKMWKVLGNFLDVDVSNVVETRKFPHRYVFEYSAIDQPKRQIRYLFDRIVSKTWFIYFLSWFWQSFFRLRSMYKSMSCLEQEGSSDISLADGRKLV